jgi:hypothetical protein
MFRAVLSASHVGRPAQDGFARCGERASVYGLVGRDMAAAAEGLPSLFDGAEVFLSMARRGPVARLGTLPVGVGTPHSLQIRE